MKAPVIIGNKLMCISEGRGVEGAETLGVFVLVTDITNTECSNMYCHCQLTDW